MSVQNNTSTPYIKYPEFLSQISEICAQANQNNTKDYPGIKAVALACLELKNLCASCIEANASHHNVPDHIAINNLLKDLVNEINPLASDLAKSINGLDAKKIFKFRIDQPPVPNPSCGDGCLMWPKELYVSTESANNFTSTAKSILANTTHNTTIPSSQKDNLFTETTGGTSSLIKPSLVVLAVVVTGIAAVKLYSYLNKPEEEKKDNLPLQEGTI